MTAKTRLSTGFSYPGSRYGSFDGKIGFPDFMRGTIKIVPYVVGRINVTPHVRGNITVNK